jgi:hypothetical protein
VGRHLNGSPAGASQLDLALPAGNRPETDIESDLAADLWSPPERTTELLDDIGEDTPAGAGTTVPTDRLVAAWMGALAGSDRVDRRVEWDGSPDADPSAYLHAEQVGDTGRDDDPHDDPHDDPDDEPLPDGVADDPWIALPAARRTPSTNAPTPPSGRSRTHRRTARRSTLATVLISLTASTAAGAAAILLVAQRADPVEPLGSIPADVRPAQRDGRVVVPGGPTGCQTMLVKPWPDGTTANVTGTCFTVG